jgi:hypothetical protein
MKSAQLAIENIAKSVMNSDDDALKKRREHTERRQPQRTQRCLNLREIFCGHPAFKAGQQIVHALCCLLLAEAFGHELV